MNQVTLKIVITRQKGSKSKRKFEYFREGHGDDMIEHGADFMERVIEIGVTDLMEKSGGNWIKPPAPPNET